MPWSQVYKSKWRQSGSVKILPYLPPSLPAPPPPPKLNKYREKKRKCHKNPGRSCQTREHFSLSQNKYYINKGSCCLLILELTGSSNTSRKWALFTWFLPLTTPFIPLFFPFTPASPWTLCLQWHYTLLKKKLPPPVGPVLTWLLLKFLLNNCLGHSIFNLSSRLETLNVREQDKDVISYAKVMQGLCYL